MESLQIDILNPKAKKLLKELADLKLIKINKQPKTPDFTSLIKKIRTSSTDELTFDEITKEVELVRTKRYDKKENNS